MKLDYTLDLQAIHTCHTAAFELVKLPVNEEQQNPPGPESSHSKIGIIKAYFYLSLVDTLVIRMMCSVSGLNPPLYCFP